MRIGFTCGTFDLLHAGHVLMLEECRKQCNYLIVGLQTDPTIDRPKTKNKPIESLKEREIRLKACKYVDDVTVYHTEKELLALLQGFESWLKPNDSFVRFIGADWKDKEYTGKDLQIKVIFNSRNHGYSSSNLRQRIINEA